jgi:quercetin dioxygenase-like cupin family protein
MHIEHHFGGGVYSKETRIPAGTTLAQHVHKHDHLSILASGHVLVTVDGRSQHFKGPACLTIAAGKSHAVSALSDVVWYCIHATEETDPERVDHTLIGRN